MVGGLVFRTGNSGSMWRHGKDGAPGHDGWGTTVRHASTFECVTLAARTGKGPPCSETFIIA
jgi:hypothetical protein